MAWTGEAASCVGEALELDVASRREEEPYFRTRFKYLERSTIHRATLDVRNCGGIVGNVRGCRFNSIAFRIQERFPVPLENVHLNNPAFQNILQPQPYLSKCVLLMLSVTPADG